MNASRLTPISCHTGPTHCSTCSIEKVSCPAGTGVWVVKVLVARTLRTASANGVPRVTSSRTRSTSMNAACPSFACQAAGSYPRVRSTRTPPTPRTHSWRSRRSGPPAYSRWDSPRSAGSFCCRSVSSSRIGTRPTMTRHAPMLTERPDSRTVARQGSPLGPRTGSSGVAATSNRSSASSCQPLIGVSLGIEQTNADQRDAQVRRRLALVSGEDAEAPRIDGNRSVQPELGAEVCDRSIYRLGIRSGEPGPRGCRILRGGGDDGVVQLQERRVGRAGGEPRGIDTAQQLDGIVLGATPQRGIEHAEQRPRVAVPAPGQVGGHGRQSVDPFGNGWAARFRLVHRACKLSTGGWAWEDCWRFVRMRSSPLTREPLRP